VEKLHHLLMSLEWTINATLVGTVNSLLKQHSALEVANCDLRETASSPVS
jgi:hypothetical protein